MVDTTMTGTILSYTIIYVPTPEFAGEAPFGLAVVETPDGDRLLTRITDVESVPLEVGAKVALDHDDAHGAVYRVV